MVYPLQYSWAFLVARLVKNLLAMQERPGFNPWVGKIPWRRKMLPTPVFWPGKFHRIFHVVPGDAARLFIIKLPSLSQKPARVWQASSCTLTCVGWRLGRTAPLRHPKKVGPRSLKPHVSARLPTRLRCTRHGKQMKADSLLRRPGARRKGRERGGE